MSDKATMINVRVGPVTKAQQVAINILTPEERSRGLLALARAKALEVATDALPPLADSDEPPDA